jgi:hypothetical protein
MPTAVVGGVRDSALLVSDQLLLSEHQARARRENAHSVRCGPTALGLRVSNNQYVPAAPRTFQDTHRNDLALSQTEKAITLFVCPGRAGQCSASCQSQRLSHNVRHHARRAAVQVPVAVDRRLNRLMPQVLLDHRQRNTGLDQPAGIGVP